MSLTSVCLPEGRSEYSGVPGSLRTFWRSTSSDQESVAQSTCSVGICWSGAHMCELTSQSPWVHTQNVFHIWGPEVSWCCFLGRPQTTPLSAEDLCTTASQAHGPVGRTTAKMSRGSTNSLLSTATQRVFHIISSPRFYKEQ